MKSELIVGSGTIPELFVMMPELKGGATISIGDGIIVGEGGCMTPDICVSTCPNPDTLTGFLMLDIMVGVSIGPESIIFRGRVLPAKDLLSALETTETGATAGTIGGAIPEFIPLTNVVGIAL